MLHRTRTWTLVALFLVVAFATAAIGPAALTDNSIFVRAWARTFPTAKPLTEQAVGTQLAAKGYGEAVLWVQANPEPPAPPAPGTGWTVLPVAADARAIYVSSSTGNDANDGSEAHPEKTIAEAIRQTRNGFPDRMLLHRGDTFPGFRVDQGGRSKAEPRVIGSYGTGPRPIIVGQLLGLASQPVFHVAIVGLDFVPNPAGGLYDDGIRWLNFGGDYLFEDCRITGGRNGLVLQAFHGDEIVWAQDVTVRRCILRDTIDNGSFIAYQDGLLLEENVVENCGHPASIFVHGLYIHNPNKGVVVRGNTISRSGSHGTQLRCGGVFENNLLYFNPINFAGGMGTHPVIEGVEVWMRRNVMLGGGDIDAVYTRGHCTWFGNIARGEMTQNILADGTGGQQHPLVIDADSTGNVEPGFPSGMPTCGVLSFEVFGNVVRHWGGTIVIDPGPKTGTTIEGMEDHFVAGDPLQGVDLSLDAYMPGFLEAARNRGPGEWSEAYTAAAYNAWARGRMGMANP